jgi:hypothetical protein
VPNRITDRGLWFGRFGRSLNVRRLMYQTLIWPVVAGHDARSLGPPFNAEDLERLTHALVDGMRRNPQLGGNLFGRQVLVDKAKAIELPLRQSRHAPLDGIRVFRAPVIFGGIRQARRLLQRKTHPARHSATPEQQAR